MLAAAALATLAVPARALADESLTATGSITYTWQGDPARGCSAAGLCGVRGEVIVAPQAGTTGFSFRGTIDVPVLSPALIVRATGPGGICVDGPTGGIGSDLFITRRRHGRLVGRIEPSLSSGRCAGPTAQDLARVTLPVRRIGRRRPSYDVRTRLSFAAGPYTGTVVSTLVLRPSTGGGGFSSSSGSFSAPPPAGPRHKVLFERVTLRYRIRSLPSALTATFSGEPDPFCAALASCGAGGTLSLSLPRVSRMLTVTAEREVARRVSSQRAMADLRRGALGLDVGPSIPFHADPPVRVDETFRAGDGSSCQAASSSRAAQVIVNPGQFAGGPRDTVQVVLSDPNQAGLMRTYCPGPDDNDLFGHSSILARSTLGPGQLLRRSSVLALSRSGSFAGPGYQGTFGGGLQFSLTLEHIRAGTVQEVLP
jgi:hypothetical protein